jgi:predicted O-methyltransferase YrrM
MPSTLRSPPAAAVVERLLAQAAQQDPLAKQRVRAREAELGERLEQARRYELYGQAPLAIVREVGELLYLLALSRGAQRIVEFGTSLGLSTIFLAAAIRDGGGAGSLITTELDPDKARAARGNLAEAGLQDLVELRCGDALQTLADLAQPVDLLFLDGRNDLYLQVLGLVGEHLRPGALIAADLNSEDPDLLAYLRYVRDPDNGYISIEVPLGDGLELSVREPKR